MDRFVDMFFEGRSWDSSSANDWSENLPKLLAAWITLALAGFITTELLFKNHWFTLFLLLVMAMVGFGRRPFIILWLMETSTIEHMVEKWWIYATYLLALLFWIVPCFFHFPGLTFYNIVAVCLGGIGFFMILYDSAAN